MLLSLFTDRHAPPISWEGTWEAFLDELGPHQEYPKGSKQAGVLPCFSPTSFRSDKRGKAHALAMSFGVLDLDGITDAQLALVLDKVETMRLAACLYTTWSQPSTPAGLWRVRLLVQFDKPVEASDWNAFWPGFGGLWGVPMKTPGGIDPGALKDKARLLYGPFVPEGSPEESKVFLRWEGQPLQTATMFQAGAIPRPPTVQKISRDRIQKLGEKWKRSQQEFKAYMGQCLLTMLRGEVYAEEGERDKTSYMLCKDLVAQFPDLDPEPISELFTLSHQLMNWEPEPSIIDKLRRAQEELTEEAREAVEAELTDRKLRITQAFAHVTPERDTPYTDVELGLFADNAKCSREEFTKRWLVQRGPAYYVYLAGSYRGPYSDKDVSSAVLRDLAPASSAGVDLWTLTEQGAPRRKNMAELMAAYGSVAQSHVLDMTAQVARYDMASRTLIEAPCPVRKLEPAWSSDIAAWLEIMAGPVHHRALLDWLSLATSLHETCAALMLTGAPDTGKSLLAMGVSRLWTTDGPTDAESALGAFNEALASCPLVFADEQVPKDWKGQGRSAELRKLISARTRPYRQKYIKEATLLGAIRMIVAANNKDVLATTEHLSTNDIAAIGERFYHIPLKDEAREWLNYLGQSVIRTWLLDDLLPRHIMWLAKNHVAAREGRFLIRSIDESFHRQLTTKTGIRSDVCQVLVSYLLEPRRFDQRQSLLMRTRNYRLLVNVQGLSDAWDIYHTTSNMVPQVGRLSQALSGLSCGREAHQARNKVVQYRVIDIGHLKAWAEETEYCTVDQINDAIQVNTEDRPGMLVRIA